MAVADIDKCYIMTTPDEYYKIRIKSFSRLLEILRKKKLEYIRYKGKYDLEDFLENLANGVGLYYMDLSDEIGWRASYDYIYTLITLAKMLKEGEDAE